MHRDTFPIDNLAAWARLNNVELNGVKASSLPRDRGSGLVAKTDVASSGALLMTIPQELILSLENVWIYAKSDKDLLHVLEAVGDFSRVL